MFSFIAIDMITQLHLKLSRLKNNTIDWDRVGSFDLSYPVNCFAIFSFFLCIYTCAFCVFFLHPGIGHVFLLKKCHLKSWLVIKIKYKFWFLLKSGNVRIQKALTLFCLWNKLYFKQTNKSLFSLLDYSGEDGVVFIFVVPLRTNGMFANCWVLEGSWNIFKILKGRKGRKKINVCKIFKERKKINLFVHIHICYLPYP